MDLESDDGFVFTRARKRVIEKINDNSASKKALPTPPSTEHQPNKSQPKRARVEISHNSSKDKANVSFISNESSIDLIQIDSNSQGSSSTISIKEKQIENLNNIQIPKMETNSKLNDNSRRRSSVGNRRNSLGLRASRRSVFGYGEMGYPHPNISETDFFKHISAEMPEPSRMRVLLSWLLQRCIEFQVSTQKEELEVSKKIQKIALEALNKHEVDTFWLRRPLFPGEEDRPYNLNPQNEENIVKKRQLQAANSKLKKEIQMWKSATSFQNTRHAACLDSIRGAPDIPRPTLDQLFTSEELDALKTDKPEIEDKEIHELLGSISKGISTLESNFNYISNSTEKLDDNISTQIKEAFDLQESFLHPKIAKIDPIKLALGITRFKDKYKSEEEPQREEFKYGHSFYSRR